MSTKQIDKSGPSLINENLIQFDKCENGYYLKTEKIVVRDVKTGKSKVTSEIQAKEMYDIVTEGDYDYTLSIQDPSGNDCVIKFRHLEIDFTNSE